MNMPPDVMEVYLQPGDFFFGDASTRIRTVLGSCVSFTMWHPRRCIGGMCHYMLPRRPKQGERLQGKYAEEAIALFLQQAALHKTDPRDYEIKLFGGGHMFPKQVLPGRESISQKNIAIAHQLLERYDLNLVSQDLGATGHRNIIFEVWSGHVWVRYQPVKDVKKSR